MPHRFRRRRGFALFCLQSLVLAGAGCIPEEQWLADSSGFVYSVGKDDETQELLRTHGIFVTFGKSGSERYIAIRKDEV